MTKKLFTYLFFLFVGLQLKAQDSVLVGELQDSISMESTDIIVEDSVSSVDTDIMAIDTTLHMLTIDSLELPKFETKKRWLPDPKKALWYAIAIPGGGQIYNRKYWKLPIIYGGFVGCFYALAWNGSMYRDYSQAYMDIMDNNPNTASYKDFIPPSYDIDSNLGYFMDVFRRRKDMYRRYRDLSIFCLIGVYLISIVDAYIDAEMSTFDISRDLTMKIRPAIINDSKVANPMINRNNSYGLQCSFNF